ncbi:hypothetical protein [Microcoleus sp. B4-D4]|uniref:hypothetical protein n=1 Tax=Microcoleus sp. B4-D4 TaxID=2818667 RepID=UPI002FD54469
MLFPKGDKERGSRRGGEGEIGRGGDWERGRLGEGEIGKWGEGEIGRGGELGKSSFILPTPDSQLLTTDY